MTDSPLLWYLNRSTGFVLLGLLTMTVVLGIIAVGSTGGRAGHGLPRFVSQSMHRNVALLSVVLLAVHVTTAIIDSFVDIRWWQAFAPIGGTYQPVWLGLGALSLDLIAAVVLTSVLRTRIKNRSWRLVHLLSYVSWAVAVVHGVGIGTDMSRENPWGLVVTAACVAVVTVAGAWRLTRLTLGRNDLARITA